MAITEWTKARVWAKLHRLVFPAFTSLTCTLICCRRPRRLHAL
ncbi:hypothetical protein OHA98_30790 [Streptomyces sp. NBC_00654]|nr:hypothetical protein [Streptomyces sp. NBC_00654]MCX4969077.1 hypothetical protein [Streptomyces sp. NBC_00654]